MNATSGTLLKQKILERLIQETSARLVSAQASYQSALEHSRSDDMKSEGKYDTRAIEAGYLASAKKQRVDELQGELLALKRMLIKDQSKASMGSLVKVECERKESTYFLCPVSDPNLDIEGEIFSAISITSPFGKEVMGLEEGDAFELTTPKGTKEYLILKIS